MFCKYGSSWTHYTLLFIHLKKKVREKSRECHNYKPQPFPDPKRKKKPTSPNKLKSNKRTKSTKISSLFPKRGNRNTKRTKKHKNKMTHGKTYNKVYGPQYTPLSDCAFWLYCLRKDIKRHVMILRASNLLVSKLKSSAVSCTNFPGGACIVQTQSRSLPYCRPAS